MASNEQLLKAILGLNGDIVDLAYELKKKQVLPIDYFLPSQKPKK